jgi:hypothetical protein
MATLHTTARAVRRWCMRHVGRMPAGRCLTPSNSIPTTASRGSWWDGPTSCFLIDAEARNAGMDHAARHALRQERSRPLLAIIKQEMEAAQVAALPSSALGRALSYTLSLWHKLTRFLEHPELELSNNLAENSMRGVALGRKN